MNWLNMTTTGFKPKRSTPWIAVALLVGGVALLAATVQPLVKHYQAALAALAKGDVTRSKRRERRQKISLCLLRCLLFEFEPCTRCLKRRPD
jgi:hypothetical protein